MVRISKELSCLKILRSHFCADINLDAARKRVREFTPDAEVVTVDELLRNPEITHILNLTTPQSHAEINMKVLEAGKHAYCEKPFAINRDEAKKVMDLAKQKNLRVGCAPDTFLGRGIQNCRKIIDDGVIGRPLSGTAFCMGHGHESWHKSPAFYYLKGGGPLFDMGPYYITALVSLLGPVRRVAAITGRGFEERTTPAGVQLPVEVDTHCASTLEFECGALITFVTSFDVWKHKCGIIEIHGEKGSMTVPDPNAFKGPVSIISTSVKGSIKGQEWEDAEQHYKHEVMRGAGLADMIKAVETGRRHRCDDKLAYHVLDVMLAFEESSNSGKHIIIESQCDRPEPLPLDFMKKDEN